MLVNKFAAYGFMCFIKASVHSTLPSDMKKAAEESYFSAKQSPFSGPKRNKGVDSASAMKLVLEQRVTESTPLSQGKPVLGSRIWWYHLPFSLKPLS